MNEVFSYQSKKKKFDQASTLDAKPKIKQSKSNQVV